MRGSQRRSAAEQGSDSYNIWVAERFSTEIATRVGAAAFARRSLDLNARLAPADRASFFVDAAPLTLPKKRGRAVVSLRYFAPDAGLGGLVSSYYRLDFEDSVLVDRLRAELPQIRITTRGSGQFRFADGRVVPCPKAMLNGPTTGPVLLELKGPLTVWGVGLLPAGWGALIGSDASAMADDSVALDTVFGEAASDLPGRLRGMDNEAPLSTRCCWRGRRSRTTCRCGLRHWPTTG